MITRTRVASDPDRRLMFHVAEKDPRFSSPIFFYPKSYYKLSLRVTFTNTFDNLYKS